MKFADTKTQGFFGQTNSEVGIFLGVKYEPLSDTPPPLSLSLSLSLSSLKINM